MSLTFWRGAALDLCKVQSGAMYRSRRRQVQRWAVGSRPFYKKFPDVHLDVGELFLCGSLLSRPLIHQSKQPEWNLISKPYFHVIANGRFITLEKQISQHFFTFESKKRITQKLLLCTNSFMRLPILPRRKSSSRFFTPMPIN